MCKLEPNVRRMRFVPPTVASCEGLFEIQLESVELVELGSIRGRNCAYKSCDPLASFTMQQYFSRPCVCAWVMFFPCYETLESCCLAGRLCDVRLERYRGVRQPRAQAQTRARNIKIPPPASLSGFVCGGGDDPTTLYNCASMDVAWNPRRAMLISGHLSSNLYVRCFADMRN